jgi:hypothetical protein
MKRTHKALLSFAMVGIAMAAWFFTRSGINVVADTSLWASEYDAFRQGSIVPGAGVPVAKMKSGERLRILWVAEGKDHRAAYVACPGWRLGWVLLWQQGIAPANS